MFRFRAAKVGILVAILVLFTGCAQPGWIYTDHRELRAAMAKSGQNCGPLVEDAETWPSFDCTSAANDGYVVVYENHEELVDALYAYCRESYAEFDENDWVTSAGYFVRSGSAIIDTLRKHLDYDFYSAQAFCFEV
jgi:hypothetical protein